MKLIALAAAAALVAPAALALDAPATRQLFDKKCAFCHGEDGQAHTKAGAKLKIPSFLDPVWAKETTDDTILEAITNGVPHSKMPAFKKKLDAEQIQALAGYVRAFATIGAQAPVPSAPPNAAPGAPQIAPPPTTTAPGAAPKP